MAFTGLLDHCMATQLCWTVVTWTNNIIWGLTDQEHGRNPGEEKVQWWHMMQNLAGVFKTQVQSHTEPYRAIQSHSSSMTLDVKMAPLCVTKNSENATPRHITNIHSCYLLSLSLFPSLSYAFLSVPPCHRKCHSVRQRTCHATQTHTTLMRTPRCLLHSYPYWTHTHINTSQLTVTSGPCTLSSLRGFWIRHDNPNVFKKSWREIANCHPVLPSPAKSKKL